MSTAPNHESGIPPFVRPGEHPLQSKRYVVTTPQVEALAAHISALIDNRTPGGVVWAPPRTGKSCGLRIVKLEIATNFPNLPVFMLPAWDYTVPKEGPFMEDLLTAAGHAIVKRGKPEDKRDRLVEFMAQVALDSGFGTVFLIVDEAQQLHEKHYKWLMGIHNLLALRSVHLITVLVGQHQLVHQRSAFLRAEKENIVGRFMVKMFEFRGLRSEKEVRRTLEEYDREEYPVDSGWSFSRYFMPEQFAEGWRLAGMSEMVWRAFVQAKEFAAKSTEKRPAKKSARTRQDHPFDIPMQYFCRMVEYFLMRLPKINLGDTVAVDTLAASAVAASGYLDVLIIE